VFFEGDFDPARENSPTKITGWETLPLPSASGPKAPNVLQVPPGTLGELARRVLFVRRKPGQTFLGGKGGPPLRPNLHLVPSGPLRPVNQTSRWANGVLFVWRVDQVGHALPGGLRYVPVSISSRPAHQSGPPLRPNLQPQHRPDCDRQREAYLLARPLVGEVRDLDGGEPGHGQERALGPNRWRGREGGNSNEDDYVYNI